MKISFWEDLRKSFGMLNVALYFAWSDTKARYSRSFLGPFWIVLATLFGVVGLGVIWSVIFQKPLAEVLPSISFGLVFWYFIAGCVIEASRTFIDNASSIKGYPNPYLVFIFRHILKHLIMLGHNGVILLFISIYFGICPSVENFTWFLIGIILVVMNLIWMSALIAIVNVRFRDVELMIASIMPIVFFLTPVIFKPQQIESLKILMYLNPFAIFLRLLRDPLYAEMVSYNALFAGIIMLIVGSFITSKIYKKMIREVPYLL